MLWSYDLKTGEAEDILRRDDENLDIDGRHAAQVSFGTSGETARLLHRFNQHSGTYRIEAARYNPEGLQELPMYPLSAFFSTPR